MVSRLTFLLILLDSPALFALQPDLGEMGYPFTGKNVEIVWEASTDKLPPALDVFKVAPRIFSVAVLSNLVALGEFNDPQSVLAALKPALDGKRVRYEEPKTRKGLCISPDNGFISYYDRTAIALPRKPAQGVPSKAEVLTLGLDLLPRLGIAQSDLARKPGTGELQLAHILREEGSFDKQQGTNVTRTIMQGVLFGRAVSGVAFNGRGDCGSVRVCYGNHAKIASLDVVWRNLQPDHKVPLVSKAQVIQWIKDGKAIIGEGVEAEPIRKLTITQIVPCYLGKDATEAQKVVYPYAELTATADMGTTNATVRLSCPIFK